MPLVYAALAVNRLLLVLRTQSLQLVGMFSKDQQNILGHPALRKCDDIRGHAVIVSDALRKPFAEAALPPFNA